MKAFLSDEIKKLVQQCGSALNRRVIMYKNDVICVQNLILYENL